MGVITRGGRDDSYGLVLKPDSLTTEKGDGKVRPFRSKVIDKAYYITYINNHNNVMLALFSQ